MELTSYVLQTKKLDMIATELASTMPDGYFEEMYLSANLSDLVKMMIDCNQSAKISSDSIALVDRVVKVNRIIPKSLLYMSGAHYIICSGLYITVPMYLLPTKLVDKCRDNRLKAVLDPESQGLPSNELADYSTIKEYDCNHYSVLAKFNYSFIREFISSACNYTNIFLPDLTDNELYSVDQLISEES